MSTSIALSILIALLALSIYFYIRNGVVLDFTLKVLELSYQYEMRKIRYSEDDFSSDFSSEFSPEFHLYSKLPAYERLVFSFKKLRLESYFTKDEIEELLYGYM